MVLARRPHEEFEDIPEIESPLLLRNSPMEEPSPESEIEKSDIELAGHDSKNENQAVSESGVENE